MCKKKVLVVGGTGVAGRFIVDYLLRDYGGCELFVSSRGIHEIPDKRVGFIKMDIHDTEALNAVICQFDVVILALGPFSSIGMDVYTVCLRNHVVCIDINDDYKHAECLLDLKNRNAADFRGTIFTGMGLCPGLTTFMLEYAAEYLKEPASDACSRIYFGAGVASGKASIMNMFEGFKEDIRVISAGNIKKMNPRKYPWNRNFSFDSFHAHLPLIYFSSPEVKTIRRADRLKALRNFDCAFHLQHLPMGIVPLLRKSSLIRRLICEMVNKQQDRLDKNARNEKAVIAYASVQNRTSTVKCSLHSDSSFRLTGAFCATIVLLIIKERIPVAPGVFSFEEMNVDLHLLKETLEDNDINVSIRKSGHDKF